MLDFKGTWRTSTKELVEVVNFNEKAQHWEGRWIKDGKTHNVIFDMKGHCTNYVNEVGDLLVKRRGEERI